MIFGLSSVSTKVAACWDLTIICRWLLCCLVLGKVWYCLRYWLFFVWVILRFLCVLVILFVLVLRCSFFKVLALARIVYWLRRMRNVLMVWWNLKLCLLIFLLGIMMKIVVSVDCVNVVVLMLLVNMLKFLNSMLTLFLLSSCSVIRIVLVLFCFMNILFVSFGFWMYRWLF